MNCNLQNYWRSMASGKNRSLTAHLLQLVLLPAAIIYGAVLWLRPFLYRLHMLKTRHLPRPVIAIGNITVGGTGKTPFTILLARMLMEQGLKVAVLSRGYGGNLKAECAVVSDGNSILLSAKQCGDEPYLLARSLPGLAVLIGADRYQAGLLAMEKLQPDVFLLDDGFQHIRLHRNLNILLLDCQQPFGNGFTLPAGLLREPVGATKRADLLVLTRCTNNQTTHKLLPALPCCYSSHQLTSFHRLDDDTNVDLAVLMQAKTAAFAGIAEPAGFFNALKSKGINLVDTLALPDHEPYNTKTVALLQQLQKSSAANWLLTTDKDAVKLYNLDKELRDRIVTARLTIVLEDETELKKALRRVLAPKDK